MKNKIIFKTLMLKGEAGSTIVSMEKTGHVGTADIYTITFNDGSTTEISLENMSAITSVEKTSSTDTEDIYTITCADGSTQTFSVLNHNADIAAMSDDIDTIDARVDNFINSVVPNTVETLWTGSIKDVGDSATLSKAVSNFDYIDLYLLGSADSKYIRVPATQTAVDIQQQNLSDDASSNFLRLWEMGVSISGSTVSITKSIAWAWDDPNNSNPTVTANAQNSIPITRIDGVKVASDTPAELADVRVGADGITYESAGDAVRGQIKDINSTFDEIGKNYFDGNKFADDDYYSFSNGTVSVLKNDARAESSLTFRMPLVAGQNYVISVDHQTSRFRYQIYDDVTRTLAYNSVLSNLYATFTPAQSGKYTLKIITEASYPQYVDNLFIGKYEDWIKRIKSGITPNFTNVSGNAEAINRAIEKASLSPFKTVLVPGGNYTLEKSIVMMNGVTLKSESGASYTLANNVNAPMIVNANRSITSTIVDNNITVDGGSWDGNRANQTKFGTDGLVVGFWFTGVNNVTIKNCYITNTRTYGVLFNNANNILFENNIISVGDVNNADNGDGFHVIGPATNIKVLNSSIKSEDNALAFNADDTNHGTYMTTGNIQGVTVENVIINNSDGGQGMLLLSSLHTIKDVYINNITGVAAYLLQMNSWNVVSGNEGSYENITVKNVSMSWKKRGWNCFIYASSGGTFNNLCFENIRVDNLATSAGVEALFGFYKTYSNTPNINDLTIRDVTMYRPNLSVGEWSFVLFENVNVVFAIISGLNDRAIKGRCVPIKATNSHIYNLIASDYYINSMGGKGWINLVGTSILEKVKVQNMFSMPIQLNGITLEETAALWNAEVSNVGKYFFGLEYATNRNQLITSVDVSTFPNSSITAYFSKGQIVVNRYNGDMYLCTSSGITASREWTPNTAYGYLEQVTYNNNLYACITAGTSGSTFSPSEGDFSDCTCKWRYLYGGEATFRKIN